MAPWLGGFFSHLPCVGWLSAGCVCVCSHPWGARFCPAAAQDYNGNGIVSLAEVDGCVTAPGLQPGLSREDPRGNGADQGYGSQERFPEMNNKPALMLLGGDTKVLNGHPGWLEIYDRRAYKATLRNPDGYVHKSLC